MWAQGIICWQPVVTCPRIKTLMLSCICPLLTRFLLLLLVTSNSFAGDTIAPSDSAHPPLTRWYMLNVSPHEEQADCHLIVLPDGRKILIDIADAGDAPGYAVAALKTLGVTSVDLVVISHFHLDHYGRLLDLLDSGVQIRGVAVNVPDEVCAQRELPWGCHLDHVRATLETLRTHGIAVFTPRAGDCLIECAIDGKTVAKLEVVCLYHGIDAPIGPTDVNDTSIIVRLTHGSQRALFTGDLNIGLGTWLAQSEFDLSANILKVPHHGTEGTAPDVFFDRVHATAALVPSPKNLWLSGRSMRIRNYFASRHIPTYVSGIHGNVTVTFQQDSYSIETER
jgi:beta-lactamase superfamily II metal-dependent hydrolase